jgi:hypothetical protein
LERCEDRKSYNYLVRSSIDSVTVWFLTLLLGLGMICRPCNICPSVFLSLTHQCTTVHFTPPMI